jgi:hypothetical protein
MKTVSAQFREMQQVMSNTKAWEHYKTDQEMFGVSDRWRIPTIDDQYENGDCEDFSMLFAYQLISKNSWSNKKVLLALCQLKNGQDHMVALASTPNGHFVLDCRMRFPLPPRSHKLRIKRWYAASPLFLIDWRVLIVPGGPLPTVTKNGHPNSEFLISGRPLRAHTKHVAWLTEYLEKK